MSLRSLSTLFFTLLATALLAGGQLWIRADREADEANILFVAGALLVAFFLAWRRPERTLPANPTSTALSASALILLVLGSALVIGGSAALYLAWTANFRPGWAALLCGTALLSGGIRLLEGENRQACPWTPGELVGLGAALIAGGFLRIYGFDEFPGPFTTHAIEEQQTGLGGTRILTGERTPWEFTLDYHLTALALWFSDAPTFNTIRVPFTLASWLTIIASHALFRQLFRPGIAGTATVLFSVLGWNVLYSRCAHPIFLTNLLVVCILGGLVHFARTRRWTVLPWVGLLTGYTLYSYAGFRGTPLFVAIFLGGLTLSCLRARAMGKATARPWATSIGAPILVAAMILATAFPLVGLLGESGLKGYYLEAADRSLANKDYYTDDTERFVEQRVQRIIDVGRTFMHIGDGSLTFNSPGQPMLDPVVATLFVVGLLIAVVRPGRYHAGFFLIMLVVLLAGGTVFVQNLDIRRLQGITILIVYFAGLALEYAASRPTGAASLRRVTLTAVMGIAVIGVFGWSYRTYFVEMAQSPSVKRAFRDHYTAMIQFGRTEAPADIGLLSIIHRFFDPAFHYRANYAWLIDSALKGRDLGELHDVLAPDDPTTLPETIVVQGPWETDASVAAIQTVYPAARCAAFPIEENPFVSLSYCELPNDRRPRPIRSMLAARYWFEAEATGEPDLQRAEPFIGYVTVPEPCYRPRPGQACRAEWQGTLRVPADGESKLWLERIGRTQVELRVDGRALPFGPTPIAPGEHELLVRATLPKDWETGVRLSWWRDGQSEVVSFLETPR